MAWLLGTWLGRRATTPPPPALLFFCLRLTACGAKAVFHLQFGRQLIDYGTMYNRNDLSIQQRITDCMFVCCMNPKSGSFFVDIRLTRHLTTVCLSVPEKEILSTIYSQLLSNHFKEFDEKTQKKGPMII